VYLLASFEQTIEIDSIFNADRDQKLIAGMPWEDGKPFSRQACLQHLSMPAKPELGRNY
jgi:hypothetical protein